MKRTWLLAVAVGLALVALLTGKQFLDISLISRTTGPLAVACLLAWTYLARSGGKMVDKGLLLAVLGLSATADVFMSWGTDLTFLVGMGLFVIVHVLLVVLFVRRGGLAYSLVMPAIGFGGIAITITGGFLWSHLDGAMLVAVPVYVAVLTTMVALAWSVWLRNYSARALCAALGALCFYVSDTLIALEKFSGLSLPLSDVWILISYWAALALIAFSLVPTRLSRKGR